jgi:hypothetical protein
VKLRRSLGSAFRGVLDQRPDLGFYLLPAQVSLHPEMDRQAHSRYRQRAQHQKYKKYLDDHDYLG